MAGRLGRIRPLPPQIGETVTRRMAEEQAGPEAFMLGPRFLHARLTSNQIRRLQTQPELSGATAPDALQQRQDRATRRQRLLSSLLW